MAAGTGLVLCIGPRSQMRLSRRRKVQHGTSRRTGFLNGWVATAIPPSLSIRIGRQASSLFHIQSGMASSLSAFVMNGTFTCALGRISKMLLPSSVICLRHPHCAERMDLEEIQMCGGLWPTERSACAWAYQRPSGGRGFGWTGGHYFSNWQHDDYRKAMLNAIVWVAGVGIPPGSAVSTAQRSSNQHIEGEWSSVGGFSNVGFIVKRSAIQCAHRWRVRID